VKIRYVPGQLVFDFLKEIDDNHCSSVHEKSHEVAINNFMGARQLGRVRPNGVIAVPILPDRPYLGKGPSMSIAEALAAYAAPAAPAKRLTPDEIRRQRGQAIAEICRVVPEGKDNRYRVPSRKGSGSYLVSIDPKKGPDWQCECKDFETRGEPCKHVFAVKATLEREKNGTEGIVAKTKTLTVKERTLRAKETVAHRPTLKRDWPSINAASTNEKSKFQGLLRDLCQGIPQPQKPNGTDKGGERRLSLADMVFSVIYKVYSTFSGRRFMCDLTDAKERGYIDKVPHFNSLYNYP
jgi:hypothetical protein